MNPQGEWGERLVEMEGWYRQLLSEGETAAENLLEHDYGAFVSYLANIRGRVLDVGGGAGLAGRYLDKSCEYVVIDPAAVWEEPGWQQFSQRFRSGQCIEYVRGVGENLPFANNEFDAVFAFWSLNHAQSPENCILEIARVLKPEGKCLLVLEDMEPNWGDLVRRFGETLRQRLGGSKIQHVWHQPEIGGFCATLRHKLANHEWPLQSDHIRITEKDLKGWLSKSFAIEYRAWCGGYLTFEIASTK